MGTDPFLQCRFVVSKERYPYQRETKRLIVVLERIYIYQYLALGFVYQLTDTVG
jgi:hypothetical protein